MDPRLLASALMGLLENALENTRPHGRVTLRTRGENGRAFVEVEDEGGGIGARDDSERREAGRRSPRSRALPLHQPEGAESNGGEIHAHNLPGKGCVFGIELPLAASPDAGP